MFGKVHLNATINECYNYVVSQWSALTDADSLKLINYPRLLSRNN